MMLDISNPELKKNLLNTCQRDFPLVPRPYLEIAERLGMSEKDVLACVQGMLSAGEISRVGATIRPNTLGASTLAAMAVDEDKIDFVADVINSYAEVNHNYKREHRYNLWFVIISESEEAVSQVIEDMTRTTGIKILNLPLLQGFHIDLGFDL